VPCSLSSNLYLTIALRSLLMLSVSGKLGYVGNRGEAVFNSLVGKVSRWGTAVMNGGGLNSSGPESSGFPAF